MRSLQQARLFLETSRRGGHGSHPDKLLYMVDDSFPLLTDIQWVFQILHRPKRPEKFQGIYFVQFYNHCSVKHHGLAADGHLWFIYSRVWYSEIYSRVYSYGLVDSNLEQRPTGATRATGDEEETDKVLRDL